MGSAAVLLAVFLVSSATFELRQFAAPQSSTKQEKTKSAEALAAETRPPKLESSDLGRQIEKLISESQFASARWGISVISLTNGAVIHQRDSDKLFIPASNMKIYTTAAAVELLGADYRWRTSAYSNAQPDGGGIIRGDLVLYGRGAPDLVSQSRIDTHGSIAKLADGLQSRGIKRIEGNIVGDESYFRGDPIGNGWQWTDLQWYFGAEASALSVNGNEIDVNLVPSSKSGQPPEVKVGDNLAHMTIQNRMETSDKDVRPAIGVHRGLSNNNVEVWGQLTPSSRGFGARLSVHNPALWAAELFAAALKSRGIVISGQVQSRSSRVAVNQRFDPAKANELAFVNSQPLSEIIKRTNKDSNNLYAELLLRTLGRERAAIAALPPAPGRERGDDETGLAVLRTWLSRAGVSDGRLALHDGSGLSRLNLVTPDATARLLVAMTKTNSAGIFKVSLPVAGVDGTLGGRLKAVSDKVEAKTGSLTYANSLSGYLTTNRGERMAFSILCNDQTSPGDSSRLIDQIVSLLVSHSTDSAKSAEKSE
ncbi:MAG TPA: D-alanyl-D-alanine carboxypeptidase/D-alanyl-D-alanine-endopeptidase [Pyrinomonadaceae bacterium]|nr:D-alanyl-D-alanine carboxypeptidase/D-alanyl-D-alanine-endopeptidase [Pyrinomonadaceae bacterium]